MFGGRGRKEWDTELSGYTRVFWIADMVVDLVDSNKYREDAQGETYPLNVEPNLISIGTYVSLLSQVWLCVC